MVWARRALAFCLAARSRALTALPPLPALDAAVLQDSHGVSAEQNWLVPGRVMLGRYPGSGRGKRVDAVVDALRTAGVTTFVCLQSELPPRDSGETNPPGFESYHAAAVNFDGPAPSFVHFGIPDREPAGDLASLRSLVADLAARVLKNGECLFIHCWGGKGRTGLVAACLLGLLYESSAPRRRSTASGAETRTKTIASPETDPQRDQVRAFFAAVRGGPSHG
ncbi:cyclin-dependent kinase inhibitor 3 [Aureococcus anophagefferens]|nr:cyclin-dependent kinase inhibitor 3 [Aureococcus anophagefferens]